MTIAEHQEAFPAPHLRPYVRRYIGYHYCGFSPGVHIGLPTPDLSIVLSLDEPTLIALAPGDAPEAHTSSVSGLTVGPAAIHHSGTQYGMQLVVTPTGARALLGMPAGALAYAVAPLPFDRIIDALRPLSWVDRFATLDVELTEMLVPTQEVPELREAWRRVITSGGAARVADLAAETGWSRRTLTARFTADYGVGPKEALRLARFARSKALVHQTSRLPLADVAAQCGYYDQAHLAREWRALAGFAPSGWLVAEVLPIHPSQSSLGAAS